MIRYRWYDHKSQSTQRWFKQLRCLEIISARSVITVGVLGALVAILTSVISLNKFQDN